MKYLLTAAMLFFPFAALADETITTTASNDAGAGTYGYQSNSSAFQAIDFTPSVSGTLTQIVFGSRESGGNPSDQVNIGIWTDDGSNDPQLALGTSTAASLTSGATCDNYTVTASISVTAGTKYWAVYARTGAYSTTDYYGACGNAASGNGAQYDGTADWTATNVTPRAVITITEAAAAATPTSIVGLVRSFWF